MTKTKGALGALLLVAAAGCGEEESGPAPCVEQPGHACTWLGVTGELGYNGDGKHRLETILYWPEDVSFAPDGTPWFLDWNNHMVRKVRPDDTVETVVGTFVGDGPPDGSDLAEPGAPGLTVALNHPTDMVFQPDGTILLAAWHNHKIRRIDPETGYVLVLYGRGGGYAGDGGPAADARFNQPKAVELDEDGSLLILDQRNFRIRRVAPDGSLIATEVGTGTAGYAGDGGPADACEMAFEAGGNPEPSGALARGPDGTLYIADALNQRIRSVDSSGIIDTIAGNGEAGYSGDGGPATEARINNVKDLEFGPDGRLYLADTDNHVIRAIDLQTGIIETVAGSGTRGALADGKPAREIQLDRPFGIAFDPAGALYISDTFNSRVVKIP